LSAIVTVTANAALDRTLVVDVLEVGRRQRLVGERAQAGGKGVNVARVLRALQIETRSVVVIGGATGATIERDLEAAQLGPVAVRAPGESRTCVEIVEATGRATQLHGAGVNADAVTLRDLLAAVEASLAGARWLALCGSLPPGLPEDSYARLVAVARARGVRVALDASGAALRAGWAAAPDLLRINRDEAAEALGVEASAVDARLARQPDPCARGVISDGAGAIVAWSGDARWRVVPPRVRVRNAIGCGDAMLAGLLATIDARPFAEALHFAIALAAADAECDSAGRPDLARAAELERALGAAVA
jgi:1-phosphofructokinase